MNTEIFELTRSESAQSIGAGAISIEAGHSGIEVQVFDGGHWAVTTLDREEALSMAVAIIEHLKESA